MAGKIYLVRHGATKLNNTTDMSEDRIRGWTNVPLTEEGREEARKAGAELRSKGVQIIVASDLSRAHETAEIIGQVVGVKPITSFKLRPWNLGKFTTQSTKVALPEIADYVQHKPDEPVPEGESFDSFCKRAFAGVAGAVSRAAGRTLVIVTHHRLERLIEAWVAAGSPSDHSINLKTFLEKGDPPGQVEELHLNIQSLGDGGGDTPAEKLSHKAVNYGIGKVGSQCKDCEYFHGKNNCDLVVPPIYPGGWCDKFEKKDASTGVAGGGDEMASDSPSQYNAAPANGTNGVAVAPKGLSGNHPLLAHGRAIAGAKALHAVGHIGSKERDKHVKASTAAIKRAALGVA